MGIFSCPLFPVPDITIMQKFFRRLLPGCFLFLFYAISPLKCANVEIMPLDKITPGMRGLCKTVFQGDSIEELDVEIIGTLKNFLPKKDIILARLYGEKIEYTGLVSGMSGSPVYLDGKLIGAIAYGWSFSKEPIAGITPIEQMLEIGSGTVDKSEEGGAARLFPGRAEGRSTGDVMLYNPEALPLNPLFESDNPMLQPSAGSEASRGAPSLTRLEVPLVFSGCHPETVSLFGEAFRRYGLVPLMGGGGTSLSNANKQIPFEAGSPVSAQLVRGDLSLAATGTMTYRDSSRILAFGHPFMLMGAVDFPMTAAEIVTVMPSLQTSFKISNSTEFMGTITNDHTNGVMGVVGGEPVMIPVAIQLEEAGSVTQSYHYEMISHKMLTPLLGSLIMVNSLMSSGHAASEQTVEFSGKLELKDYEPVVLEDMFAGIGAASLSSRDLQSALHYLFNNSYGPAQIQRIDLKMRLKEGNPKARVSKVFLDRDTACPGDSINLEIHLDPFTEPLIKEYFKVFVPDDKSETDLFILVGSGDMITRTELQLSPERFRYTSIEHLVRLINQSRKSNYLYVKVFRQDKGLIMGDQIFPGLPPSVWTLLNSEKTTGAAQPIADLTIEEHERPTRFIISGFKIIHIDIQPRP